MRTLLIAIAVLLAIHVAVTLAGPGPLLLDHDFLTSMARTGAPGINIEYTADRVLFKTRVRRLVWIDVRLEALFVRVGARVHLAARKLTAAGLLQNGSRFDEAAAKLAKLVDVETLADRVEVYKAGTLVYSQAVGP